jgi:CheY-like chemotaxis protein
MESPEVLIADNDRAVGALLGEVVGRLGCRATMVHDGEAARGVLRQRAVGLLVCDLDMPRLTGMELLDWLRGQPVQPPVVVISGYLDGPSVQRIEQMPSVRRVMRKPFDLVAFGDLVRALALPAPPAAAASP